MLHSYILLKIHYVLLWDSSISWVESNVLTNVSVVSLMTPKSNNLVYIIYWIYYLSPYIKLYEYFYPTPDTLH